MVADRIKGALAGWKHNSAEHGIFISLQIAGSVEDHKQRNYARVDIGLNDRQLRSLARDLERIASQRGLDLHARPSLWRRLFSRRRRPEPAQRGRRRGN